MLKQKMFVSDAEIKLPLGVAIQMLDSQGLYICKTSPPLHQIRYLNIANVKDKLKMQLSSTQRNYKHAQV